MSTPPNDPHSTDGECLACEQGDTPGDCPKAGRRCGHHCNHIWTDAHCCWCDLDAGEPPTPGKSDRDIANELSEVAERVPRHEHARSILEARHRLLSRSVLLNKISWQLHEAMGVIPEGAETYFGDIEADLAEICATIRQGRR